MCLLYFHQTWLLKTNIKLRHCSKVHLQKHGRKDAFNEFNHTLTYSPTHSLSAWLAKCQPARFDVTERGVMWWTDRLTDQLTYRYRPILTDWLVNWTGFDESGRNGTGLDGTELDWTLLLIELDLTDWLNDCTIMTGQRNGRDWADWLTDGLDLTGLNLELTDRLTTSKW